MTVYCATSNRGKLREFQLAISSLCRIEPLPGLAAIAPPEETGSTFEENAIQKALYYGAFTQDWLFAEDSGLSVEALNGEPGVYSARYAGVNASNEANNQLVLERMRATEHRAAAFICVIALVRSGRLFRTFRGEVYGEVLPEPCGEHGFGYDPIFYYPEFGCSFAEAPAAAKQTVSHRGKALAELLAYLRKVSNVS